MAITKKAMAAKVRRLKELEAQIAALQAQADEIKEALKSVLETAGAEEMRVDIFTIRYKTVISSRFDSTAFRSTHSDLYAQYCKPTTCKRFTIN